MAKPRLQSLGHDVSPSPPPPFPPSSLPQLLRDADGGGWRCRNLCASLGSFASLRSMPIPHEQLGSLLYSSKPSAISGWDFARIFLCHYSGHFTIQVATTTGHLLYQQDYAVTLHSCLNRAYAYCHSEDKTMWSFWNILRPVATAREVVTSQNIDFQFTQPHFSAVRFLSHCREL